VQFGLLGLLLVDDGQSTVDVSAPRLRVLLAALLMHAGRVMPADELVETLWDELPPSGASGTLRAYVMRLRRSLGPLAGIRVITRYPGYLIEVAEDELDLLRFTALCQAGGTAVDHGAWADAAGVLGDALAMWRGPALMDVPSQILHRDEVPRLDQLRLQALEWRVDAILHLGGHARLVQEVQALAEEHPLRERFHAQLMLALYRSGRQAEALDAYRAARAVLVRELGAEPGPDLRRLHERILSGDPDLMTSGTQAVADRAAVPVKLVTVPRQLPPLTPYFVGRAAELNSLTSLLDQASKPGVVVISAIGGAAGIGKTALAVCWAHRVADRFPDGQLYVNLRGFDPAGTLCSPAEALRSFLAALTVPTDRLPGSLDAQIGLYRSLMADKRMLIVLDNARDADQIRPLLPGSPTCAVVVTSRSQFTSMVAAEGAYPINLDLLSGAEASELLTRHLGAGWIAREPAAAAELTELCARLPLALSIAAARVATTPALSLAAIVRELRNSTQRLDALSAGDATGSVREVFSWSYQHLPRQAADMFRLLGLHPGPDITVAAAASMAGFPARQAHRLLGQLVQMNLLTEHVPGRFAFHDLLRAYAAEQAGAYDRETERQEAIHRILDHYLHTGYDANRLMHPARVPRIELAPPRTGVVPEILASSEQALEWFTREHLVLLAVGALAAATGFDAHAWQIPWTMTDFLDRRGHWQDWIDSQRIALSAARRLGDHAAQGYAHRYIGRASIQLGAADEAIAHLTRALEFSSQLGDPVGEGYAHIDLGRALEHQGQYREALVHSQLGLALHTGAGCRVGEAFALNAVGWLYAHLGKQKLAIRHCRKALDLHDEVGDRFGAAVTWDSLGFSYHRLGDYPQAQACYREAARIYQDLGELYQEAATLIRLGEACLADGRQHATRDAWQRAVSILNDMSHPEADIVRFRIDGLTLRSKPALAAATGNATSDRRQLPDPVTAEQTRCLHGDVHACSGGDERGSVRGQFGPELAKRLVFPYTREVESVPRIEALVLQLISPQQQG